MGTISNGESGLSVRNKLNDVIDKIEGTTDINNAINIDGALSTDTSLNIASSTTVDGILDEDNMASNSATKLATQQSIKAYVDAQVGTVDTLAEVLGNGNTTGGTDIAVSTGDDITFADSSKAIFGAGDLQIYHDGSNSYIDAANVGNLILQSQQQDKDIVLRSDDGSGGLADYVTIDGSTGQVKLRHYSDLKLATTSTGVDITGTLTSDGLTVDGSALVQAGNGATATLSLNNGDGNGTLSQLNLGYTADPDHGNIQYTGDMILSTGGNKDRLKIASNGDISFYEDTGSTAKLSWSASNERLFLSGSDYQFGIGQGANQPWYSRAVSDGSYRLHLNGTGDIITASSSESVGIGTSDPATLGGGAKLAVNQGADGNIVFARGGSTRQVQLGTTSTTGYINADNTSGGLAFHMNGTERMRIDSSGNVGIATTDPVENLTVGATTTTAGFSLGSATTQVFLRYNNYFSGTSQVSDATKGSASISLGRSSDGVITFNTAAAGAGTPSEAMRIDSSGNVGIGGIETTDTYPLMVKSNSSHHGIHIEENSGGEGYTLGVDADGDLGFYNSGAATASVTFDDSGNVGIGGTPTNFSDHKSLALFGASGNGAGFIEFNDTSGNADGAIFADNGTLFINADYDNTTASSSIRFRIDGSSEKMRIDSSGNVRMGDNGSNPTDTDADNLIVANASGAAGIQITSSSSSVGKFVFGDADNARSGMIYYSHTSNFMRFDTVAEERMRIDSSGNVGIGTATTSSAKVHISTSEGAAPTNTTSYTGALRLTSTATAGVGVGPSLMFRGQTGNSTAEYSFAALQGVKGSATAADYSGHLVFYTQPSGGATLLEEAMRIDSSGNLLVGTTDTTVYDNNANSSADNGLNLRGDGKLDAARYNGPVLGLNRTGTDGTLAEFRKSGTTVGSISTHFGSPMFGKAGGARLAFATSSMYPSNDAGTTENGTLDIGTSSGRFKDLYLSGGVYLGGTAATNKLDDYEDGSWTVNLYKGGSALAVTNRYGYYRRVGDLLHISFYWLNSSITTTGTSVYSIQGMPFNLIALANGAYQFCPVGYNSIDSNNVHRWQANSSTELQMYGAGGATNVSSGLLEFSGAGVFRI